MSYSLLFISFLVRVKYAALLSVNCYLIALSSTINLCTRLCTITKIYIMDFSLESLYSVERDVDSVFGAVFGVNWSDVSKSTVTKLDKGTLSNLVLSAVSVLGRSKGILRSAAVCVEGLKQDQIENQKTLLKIQDDLLKSKTEQVEAVQKTMEA